MINETWAILPEVFEAMQARLKLYFNGSANVTHPGKSGDVGLYAVTKPGPKSGRVAMISLMGSITRRGSLWSDFFGGATVDGLISALRNVAADDGISTVLLNIDSPGGTVDGLPELASEVRKLRDSKHVVAIANSLAASAAYWVASQADEIVATPEAMVGSIGVFTVHLDYSAMMEQDGVKATFIQAGKYKTEANPYQPLTEEAQQHLQSLVDEAYGLFVADVAKGRGVTAAQVRSDYGQGRVLTAKDAKAAGLIDRIAGYQETIARLTGLKADDETPEIEAETPSPQPSPIGEGETVGNSLAAKRLRLELLEKF
jgi:signal peptide peptidase SppA